MYVIVCGFGAARAGHRVTVLDNKRCLLSALTEPVVKGQGLHSGSSLVILCVCVSHSSRFECVLCPLWSATDPGFYPARLIVGFHMSAGIYCSRQAGCCRQESVGILCEIKNVLKATVLFLFQLNSWMIQFQSAMKCLLLVIVFIDLFMMVLIITAAPRDQRELMRKNKRHDHAGQSWRSFTKTSPYPHFMITSREVNNSEHVLVLLSGG